MPQRAFLEGGKDRGFTGYITLTIAEWKERINEQLALELKGFREKGLPLPVDISYFLENETRPDYNVYSALLELDESLAKLNLRDTLTLSLAEAEELRLFRRSKDTVS